MKLINKIKEKGLGYALRRIDSKYGIGRLERGLASNWLNPFLTLWINFRSLSFKQALRLPIYVYGRPRIYCTSGKIELVCPVKSGMVTFNRSHPGSPSLGSVQSEFYNAGIIKLGGKGQIDTGTRFMVSNNGILEMGDGFKICDMVNFACTYRITMGKNVRIVHRCQVFDNNYHSLVNTSTGIIPPRFRPIVIGSNVWICNSATINAGAVLPDSTIVSAYGYVSKDFSACPPGTVIGGIPAKVIGHDTYRVTWENEPIEELLFQYYSSNASDELFDISRHGLTLDDIPGIHPK